MTNRTRNGLIVLALVGVLAGGAWMGRTPVLTWYYLRGLAAATDADRETWATRVVSLDEAALPGLLDLLKRGEPEGCANAVAALAPLLQSWGPEQQRSLAVLNELTQHCPNSSEPGREAILELQIGLLRGKAPEVGTPANQTATRLLTLAAACQEKGVRLRALALSEVLVDRASPEAQALILRLTYAGLQAREPEERVRAIHLTMHNGLRKQTELQKKVLPLLKDSAPEVRRAALLAVGIAEHLISEEELLPFLHDSDAEVRRLCESALRGRGLLDRHLQLARLVSDPRPEVRSEVVLHLRDADDLDAGLWLKRLSLDSSPNVRASAARASALFPELDSSDLLLHLSRSDREESVRQIAEYYLRQARR